MKMRILPFLLTAVCAIFSISTSVSQDVIISQYVETNSGSTPKGIELWNPTATDIDMSVIPITILKGTNGGTPSLDFTISTGTLPASGVIVVGTSDMAGTCVGCFYEKAFTFNGDDALVIQLNGVTTDVFGTPGMDPGTRWEENGVATRNSNITLVGGITTGDTDGWTDPSERFETVVENSINDFTGFGVAPVQAAGCMITNLVIDDLRCGNNGVSPDDAYATVTFDVVEGSGNYVSIINGGVSGGISDPGNPITDGEVAFDIQLTVGTVMYGDVIDIEIRDQTDATCTATVIGLTVPDCSECSLTNVVAPNNVNIVNSTCQMVCQVIGGSITADDNCPVGFTIEYSVDGGTYSADIPVYNQEGPVQSITTRCTCDADDTVSGPESIAVVTEPGTCVLPEAPIVDNITACDGDAALIEPMVAGGTSSCDATSDLILTAAFDGPLNGGNPKGIELYVINDIADLSIYGVGSANNGGGTDGEEFSFPMVAVTAGTYIYVAAEATEFTNFFGFAPDYTSGAMSINGDDAVELFMNGVAIDVFGNINMDGTGEAWDHLDGWAYRIAGTGESTTFNDADWTYSGTNALDGETANASAATPVPVGTYTCMIGGVNSVFNFYDADPAGGTATLLAGPVESYDPMTALADSPESIFVTTVDETTGCESAAVEVVITIQCCLEPEFNSVAVTTNSSNSNGGSWEIDSGSYEVNGFCGGGCAEPVESWLVYGPIDMTGVTNLMMDVSGVEDFGTTDLVIQFSMDDGAISCPDQAAWTTVETLTTAGDYTIDLSTAMGMTVYIGVQYLDDGADGYSRWTLSDLMLMGNECPVYTAPESVMAGPDQSQCGVAPVTLAAMSADAGIWSGGVGAFADATDPGTTYTPEASEEGTQVTLTWTVPNPTCETSDDMLLTLFDGPLAEDTEFSYEMTTFCPGMGVFDVMHTTGRDGKYSVTMGDPDGLVLDSLTGQLDIENSQGGDYTVTNTLQGSGNLMISAVIDGPLPGGSPKAVELYAIADITDLSIYGIGYSNFNGPDNLDYTLPSMCLSAGDYFYIANNITDFLDYYDELVDPIIIEHETPPGNGIQINGDDVIQLFSNGALIDAFGESGVDGTGTAWEYMDGWALRNDNTGLNLGVFDETEFSYSGPGAYVGSTTNTTSGSPLAVGTFTTAEPGICPNSTFSVDIVIEDITDPVIVCPADIEIELAPGECRIAVDYEVTATDNCGIGSTVLQTLNNSSFEDGDFSNWEVTGPIGTGCNTNWTVLDTEANFCVFGSVLPLAAPASGIYAAYAAFDGFGPIERVLNQTVVVPEDAGSGAVMLDLVYDIDLMTFCGGCMARMFAVELVDPTSGIVLEMLYEEMFMGGNTYQQDWTTINIPFSNLSDYAGQEVTLSISAIVPENQTGPAMIGVDNIIFGNEEEGVVQLDGQASGELFEIGVTTNVFIVTDLNGNTSTCSFDVTILEFQDPTRALSCNDQINISIDDNCELLVNVDMFLEGGTYGCYEDFIINILPYGDREQIIDSVNGTMVDFSNLLGDHSYEVIDPDTGVSCWGNFTVEDNIEPSVVGCTDTPIEIDCDEVEDYRFSVSLDPPTSANVVDNCLGDLQWNLVDISFESFGAGSCQTRIERTWSAAYVKKDGTTDYLMCTKIYESQPVDASQIRGPLELVILGCGDDTDPEFLPFGSRYPRVGNTDLIPGDGGICNLLSTYTDEELDVCAPGCAGNKKIIRTWTVVDWCAAEGGGSGQVIYTFTQIIKAIDEEAPTFLINDITVGTNPWDCTANFEIPEVWELHDNCDANPTYVGTTGPVLVDGRTVLGAPIGVHFFDVTYTDCCNNLGTVTMQVTVVDNVGPVVSTVQDVVVSLTPGGPNPDDASAKLFWYHLDNHSYDACTDVTVEIRRPSTDPACNNIGASGYNNNITFNNNGDSDDNSRDTDGGQFVKFCCADLDAATVDVNGDEVLDAGYVEVIVRAYDENGNYNEAWSFVKVEDNSPALLTGPVAATIYCDWPIEDNFDSRTYTSRGAAANSNAYASADGVDFSKTGEATAYSTCGTAGVEYVDVIITTEGDGIDQCGAGQFTRIFRAGKEDKNGNTVYAYHFQKITILGREGDADVTQDINNPVGVGPEDFGPFVITSCSGPTADDLDEYSPVVVGDDPCDVIGRAIEIDTFFFEQGACKKWVVEYKFVNWCDDEEWNDFVPVTFMYIDTEKPVITGCLDTMYAQNNAADCKHGLQLENMATDNGGCAGEANAWLKWQVYVDLWGDGTIDAYGTSYAYSNSTSWARKNSNDPFLPSNENYSDDVWVVNIAPTGSGEATNLPALPEDLIQGNMSNHKVTWKVTDGCHNFDSCSEDIMVVDKKAPTPYCRNLSTAVMGGSDMVELWAIDFNVGSFDFCTEEGYLKYTFDGPDEGYLTPESTPDYDTEKRTQSRVFGCEDLPGGTYRMYVWDEKNNVDYCEVELTIIDSDGSCGPVEITCEPTANTGLLVLTCQAVSGTGDIGVILNVKDNDNAPRGTDWAGVEKIHPSNWTLENLGQIFGITTDGNDNIYLSTSDIYDDASSIKSSRIYKCTPPSYTAELFAELPNSGDRYNGIGNIAYDCVHDKLFATNVEDGKIYRISSTGEVLNSYDPFGLDTGIAGIAGFREILWGIAYDEINDRLYFSRSQFVSEESQEVYKLDLINGNFTDANEEELVFTVEGSSSKITDIELDASSTVMMTGERGFGLTGVHSSYVRRYDNNNGLWVASTSGYNIGANALMTGANSSGGVALGYSSTAEDVTGNPDTKVWAGGNYMITSIDQLVYGVQGIDITGNNPVESPLFPSSETDIFIDADGVYNIDSKGTFGDVEMIKCKSELIGSRSDISGTVATSTGATVANVATTIESILPEYPKTEMTNVAGTYMFADNPVDVDYKLTVEKSTGLLEGVNTLDLVKIQRHLLGLELLDNPYKVIAADIDNDESIKPGDLLTLRKAILGLSDEFTNNTSWRFVDGSQSNDDLSLVNDYISTGMLTGAMMDENFVAVKVGDVDGTVDGLLADGEIATRSSNVIRLVAEDQTLEAGELVEVTFTSSELSEVYGYQFTMDLEGLEFAGVRAGAANMTEANVGVLNSVVTVSYNDVTAMNVGSAEGLFTMSFVATEAGQLSEMMSSTSSVTRAEAYVGERLETVGVEIAMRGANTEVATFELLQNEPNPFKSSTTIGFTLPAAGSADLTVLDVTGKLLMSRSVEGVAGYNEVIINKGDIGVSGVLYYTLENGDFTATKKMIMIE